jgi:hypothetical protein
MLRDEQPGVGADRFNIRDRDFPQMCEHRCHAASQGRCTNAPHQPPDGTE